MKIEITEEQVSYLKGLDSKKKQRKFLLDCFVEEITTIGKSVKIGDLPITENLFVQDELLKFDAMEIQKDKDAESYRYCNNILNFNNLIIKCITMKSDPSNILKSLLLSTNKYYHYKTEKTIEFIDELFCQLKPSQSANSEKKYTIEEMRKCFEEARLTLPS